MKNYCSYKKYLCLFIMLLFSTTNIPNSYGQEDLMPLNDLCIMSSDIIKAEVISVRSKIKDIKRVKVNRVKVLEVYKGSFNINEEFEFNTLEGGAKQGISILVEAPTPIPIFKEGEQAILFLCRINVRNPDNSIRRSISLAAFSESKFKVVKDKFTQVEVVKREKIMVPLILQNNKKTYSMRDPLTKEMKIIRSKPNLPNNLKKWGDSINISVADSFLLEDFIDLIQFFIK